MNNDNPPRPIGKVPEWLTGMTRRNSFPSNHMASAAQVRILSLSVFHFLPCVRRAHGRFFFLLDQTALLFIILWVFWWLPVHFAGLNVSIFCMFCFPNSTVLCACANLNNANVNYGYGNNSHYLMYDATCFK